ncbi:Choline transporter protein 5-A [Fasciola hepatica]|uniref:Choline transporter-like protein n=1 Tax=Fasciola hepatica TaxID=6192 RepID=A0A4E0RHB2_FASHE|nr:Choline transporter protein 5-A [Fasciola hepatica]
MGDYRRVLYPTNSQGLVCGRDVPDKPYLYFFDIVRCLKLAPVVMIVGCPTPQVSLCPPPGVCPVLSRLLLVMESVVQSRKPDRIEKSHGLFEREKCKRCGVCPLLFGRCLPSQLKRLISNGTGEVYDKEGKLIPLADEKNEPISGVSVVRSRNVVIELTDVFEKIVSDLSKSWPTIFVYSNELINSCGISTVSSCLSFAVVLSFVWIVLMRCFADIIVWSTLILFVILFSASTGFCFYRWNSLKKTAEEIPFELSLDLSSYFRSSTTWLAFGIISAILLVIILLVLIFLRKRILIAIAIIKEASKALATMTSVLFWPLLPLVLELLVIAQVLFVAVSLRSMAEPVGVEVSNQTLQSDWEDKARKDLKNLFHSIPCDPLSNSSAGKACRFLYYGGRKYTIFLQFFNLFMFFWLVNFVRSLAEMTLAGTFAHYYFSRHNPKTMPRCPLLSSFFRAGFYHIGSLALGSLLVALLQWLRVILEYVSTKLKKYDNGCTQCLTRCLCCCFWCLERFLRFLNRNAFIMISIYGQSFCSGARSAFYLLLRNAVRLVVVDKVTDFILFIGKLVVVGLSSSLGYLYLDGILFANTPLAEFQPTMHYVIVPLAIIIVGSYVIVSLFSSVYEMGVDTIFLCFLEDLERNDGSAEHPYFMSKQLMTILGKKNLPDKTGKPWLGPGDQ